MSGDPEQQLDDEADDLVGHQKEQCRDHDEDEDHAGGDHGLAPGRPGDFRHFGTDLANELDGVLGHSRCSSGTGRSGGTRTPDPRFWRPMLYQLSYTPTGRRPGPTPHPPPLLPPPRHHTSHPPP